MKTKLYSIISTAALCLMTFICLVIFEFTLCTTAAVYNSCTDTGTLGNTSLGGKTADSSNKPIGSECQSDAYPIQVAAALNSEQKVAYLTFDDGPSKRTTELLDILKDCKVHATFFVIGLNAEKYPDVLKQMIYDGNVIGVHSWTHKYSYIYKNTQNFLDDFNKLKDYIKQTTGVKPDVCRFPGGTNNTVCFSYNKDHIMKSIVAAVQNMGFEYYDWNVSSGEANAVPPSTNEIINTVVSQCKGKSIAVILFHDTGNPRYNAAIPEIVSELRSMGFVFDTLSPNAQTSSKSSFFQFKPS